MKIGLVLSDTEYKSDDIEEVLKIENLTEMLKGSLEGCVLEIISRHETYGYEITRRLNELGFIEVVEGTVYTILVRLEKKKLVNIEKNHQIWAHPANFIRLMTQATRSLSCFGKGGILYHQKSTS